MAHLPLKLFVATALLVSASTNFCASAFAQGPFQRALATTWQSSKNSKGMAIQLKNEAALCRGIVPGTESIDAQTGLAVPGTGMLVAGRVVFEPAANPVQPNMKTGAPGTIWGNRIGCYTLDPLKRRESLEAQPLFAADGRALTLRGEIALRADYELLNYAEPITKALPPSVVQHGTVTVYSKQIFQWNPSLLPELVSVSELDDRLRPICRASGESASGLGAWEWKVARQVKEVTTKIIPAHWESVGFGRISKRTFIPTRYETVETGRILSYPAGWHWNSGARNISVSTLGEDETCLSVSANAQYTARNEEYGLFANTRVIDDSSLTKMPTTSRAVWIPALEAAIYEMDDTTDHDFIDINRIAYPSVSTVIPGEKTARTFKPANLPGEFMWLCRAGGQSGNVGYLVHNPDKASRGACFGLADDQRTLFLSANFELLNAPKFGLVKSNGITNHPQAFNPTPRNFAVSSITVSPYGNSGPVVGFRTRDGSSVGVGVGAKALVTTKLNDLLFDLAVDGDYTSPLLVDAPLKPITNVVAALPPQQGMITLPTSGNNPCRNDGTQQLIAQVKDLSATAGSNASFGVGGNTFVNICSYASAGLQGDAYFDPNVGFGANAWAGALLRSQVGVDSSQNLGAGFTSNQSGSGYTQVGATTNGSVNVGSCVSQSGNCGVAFEGGAFAKAAYGVDGSLGVTAGKNGANVGAGLEAPGAAGASGGATAMYSDGKVTVGVSGAIGAVLFGASVNLELSVDAGAGINAAKKYGPEAIDGILFASGVVGGQSKKYAVALQDGVIVAASLIEDKTYDAALRSINKAAGGIVYSANQVWRAADGALKVVNPAVIKDGAYQIKDGALFVGDQISSNTERAILSAGAKIGESAAYAAHNIDKLSQAGAIALVNGLDEAASPVQGSISFVSDRALQGAHWTQKNLGKLGNEVANSIVRTGGQGISFVKSNANAAASFFNDVGNNIGDGLKSVGNSIKSGWDDFTSLF